MNSWQMIGNPPQCVRRKDIKILAVGKMQDFYDMVGERDCFSIGDAVFSSDAMMQFFKHEYGEKCRYEKK